MNKNALKNCDMGDSEEEPGSGEGRLTLICGQFKAVMFKQRSQPCTEQQDGEEPRQRESGGGRLRVRGEELPEAKGHSLHSSKLWTARGISGRSVSSLCSEFTLWNIVSIIGCT